MKNTLRFSLIIIGAGLLIFGVYTILFPDAIEKFSEDNSQSFAMMGFGALCLLGGLAYKRR